jgi:hypothetical protein
MIKPVMLLLLVAAPVMAQSDAVATLGDRVRVIAPKAGYAKLTGRVVATTPDALSLVVDRSPTEVAILRDQIDELYRSVGTRRHPMRGAMIGGAIGLLATIQFGPKQQVPNAPQGIESGRGTTKNLLIGGLGGAAMGGFVGYLTQTDSWVEIRPRFVPR